MTIHADYRFMFNDGPIVHYGPCAHLRLWTDVGELAYEKTLSKYRRTGYVTALCDHADDFPGQSWVVGCLFSSRIVAYANKTRRPRLRTRSQDGEAHDDFAWLTSTIYEHNLTVWIYFVYNISCTPCVSTTPNYDEAP
jgi:hypothetical protein